MSCDQAISVGVTGFEPATSCSQSTRAKPDCATPRTRHLQSVTPLLYATFQLLQERGPENAGVRDVRGAPVVVAKAHTREPTAFIAHEYPFMPQPTDPELPAHGGNLADIARTSGVDEHRLVDFSASINPLGPPDSVRQVVEHGTRLLLHYPDPDSTDLTNALAERHGCRPDSILVGNGSNEIIYLLCQLLRPQSALIVHPTFSEYGRALSQVQCRVRHVLASDDDGFAHPLPELRSRGNAVDAVFVCNPNNPTGVLTAQTDIVETVRALPQTLVVVDEAFIDFASARRAASCVDAVGTTHNLIVLRSLTKFYAMPGLRLGYAVGTPRLIERLRRFRDPWSVNALAQKAGLAAIDEHDYAERTRQFVAVERTGLINGLSGIDHLQPFPSSANFVMVKTAKPRLTGDLLRQALIAEGIVIRQCSNFPGLGPAYFRVAVRTAKENRALLDALRAARG